MIRFAATMVCLALALAGCSTPDKATDAPAQETTPAATPSTGTSMRVPEGAMQEDPAAPSQVTATPPAPTVCRAEPAQAFVGKPSSPDIIEQARVAAGARIVRTLKPGQVITMEANSARLNLDVDAQGVITGARCG